jgi:tetratricopeptide (TPR) repeat protein
MQKILKRAYILTKSKDLQSKCHQLGVVRMQFSPFTTANLINTSNPTIEVPIITKTSAKSNVNTKKLDEDEYLKWFINMEPMDQEQEMHKIKRSIGSFYTLGRYHDALHSALRLESVVKETIGESSTVYASCLNNIALMNKMLGNNDAALNKYIDCIQVYEKTVGKNHSNYAASLNNIGILYRTMSETTKGLQNMEYLKNAEDALNTALNIRIDLALNKELSNSREALNSAMNLAMVTRLKPAVTNVSNSDININKKQSINELKKILKMCKELCGREDSMTAVILSNLGIVYKSIENYDDALNCYIDALDIRSCTLGDSHPDTIISMHNLAELYIAMNDEKLSVEMQEKILAIVDKDGNARNDVDSQVREIIDNETSVSADVDTSTSTSDLSMSNMNNESDSSSVSASTNADANANANADADEDASESSPVVTYATRRKKKTKKK